MSDWANLETQVDPDFLREFGEESTYEPVSGGAYIVTVVVTDPDTVEAMDPAYRHAWAVLSDFSEPPALGDTISVGAGEFTVFKVHRVGDGVWLSLNAR